MTRELWKIANEEHPNDPAARRLRYHDLLVSNGHVVEGSSSGSDGCPLLLFET